MQTKILFLKLDGGWDLIEKGVYIEVVKNWIRT
jgi:hypothetical protein